MHLFHMKGRNEIMEKISNKVKKQIDKNQREYYLREETRAIKNELGDRAEFECEQNNFGSAAAVIKAGIKEMNKNGTVDYNNLNPVYLRVSQAERLKK